VFDVLLQASLRVVNVFLMLWCLTTPKDCMLPLHMTEPFFGRMEKSVSLFAFFKQTYIRVDILYHMAPVIRY
jgi:hypothetical protein